MPKKKETEPKPQNAPIVSERFRFEQKDSKGRLVTRSGMSRVEFLIRKFLRKIQDAF